MNRLLSSALNRLAQVLPGGFNVRPTLQRWRGVQMGKNVWLGLFVYVDDPHPTALSIGNNCTIGIRTSIITHFYWGPRRSESNGKVVIEDDVFIGPHCVILPNVTIGRGAVIKAGTVVTRNVPAGTFFGAPSPEVLAEVGVPLTSEHSYDEFVRGMKAIGRRNSRERNES